MPFLCHEWRCFKSVSSTFGELQNHALGLEVAAALAVALTHNERLPGLTVSSTGDLHNGGSPVLKWQRPFLFSQQLTLLRWSTGPAALLEKRTLREGNCRPRLSIYSGVHLKLGTKEMARHFSFVFTDTHVYQSSDEARANSEAAHHGR